MSDRQYRFRLAWTLFWLRLAVQIVEEQILTAAVVAAV